MKEQDKCQERSDIAGGILPSNKNNCPAVESTQLGCVAAAGRGLSAAVTLYRRIHTDLLSLVPEVEAATVLCAKKPGSHKLAE